MKPILYERSYEGFPPYTYGIGTLTDCLSGTVTEEINGKYEMVFEYPADGLHAEDIVPNAVVYVKPNYTDNPQLFRIYKVGKTINGKFTVNAQHISYDLSGKIITSGSAGSCAAACLLLETRAGNFNITTDKNVSASFNITEPSSVRSWFGGKSGSLLDVYGGQWYYDNYSATLMSRRGTDRGVTIRYGKNLVDLSQEINMENLCTGIIPYYIDEETKTAVTGDRVPTGLNLYYTRDRAVDFTQELDKESATPLIDQLATLAANYIAKNNFTDIVDSITLDFVQLQGVTELIELGDTVNLYYEALGISSAIRVVSTVWDILEERFKKITLGAIRSNITDSLMLQSQETADLQAQIPTIQLDLDATMKDINAILGDISDLQDQIDGNITTWYYNHTPTLNNLPASDWTTDAEKNNHIGDLFYESGTGYAYRFVLDGSTYKWVQISDQQVTEALAKAQEALDVADSKRRVFITTPVPPYDQGDLWTNGSDLYYCNVSKAEDQSFSQSDWLKATNYVNPSAMALAITNATQRITGNLGGYVILHDSDNDGNPDEILIMDTDDISTALKVWRWNKSGLGYSSTGYAGPFSKIALTADGQIVADAITTGTLNANLIKAGVISDVNNNSTIDMTNGEANLKNLKAKNSLTLIDNNNIARAEVLYNVGDGTSFNVKNSDSTVMGSLYYNETTQNGGQLRLRNKSAQATFNAWANDDAVNGAHVWLNDKQGNNNLQLYAGQNGGVISLYNASGKNIARIEQNEIRLNNANGNVRASLWVSGYDRGTLYLYDENGNNKITLFGDGIINAEKFRQTNGLDELFSGSLSSGSAQFSREYSALVVVGLLSSGGSRVTSTIPIAMLDSNDKRFQISDESDFVSYDLKLYGTRGILLSFVNRSSSGYIEKIYGML